MLCLKLCRHTWQQVRNANEEATTVARQLYIVYDCNKSTHNALAFSASFTLTPDLPYTMQPSRAKRALAYI